MIRNLHPAFLALLAPILLQSTANVLFSAKQVSRHPAYKTYPQITRIYVSLLHRAQIKA
jgi:hypothetical protein